MDITLEQLEEMSDQELLEFAVKNMEDTKKMRVFSKDTSEIEGFKKRPVYTFDSIKKYVECDKEKGTLTVPFIDEREIDVFKKVVFSEKNRADRIHWKGFFSVLRVTIMNELFGLVTTNYACLKVNRKEDPRFPNDMNNDRKEERMYYDYKNSIFQQVPDKKMKQGEDGAEEHNQHIEEFNRRNEMKDYLLERLDEMQYRYLRAFDTVYELDKSPGQQRQELIHYYQTWNQFFTEELEQGMRVALVYNHIGLEEYKVFIQVCEQYQPIIEKKYNQLLHATVDEKGEVDKDWYRQELESVTLFLTDFISERKENSEKYGFFVWELIDKETKEKKTVINPTISEIERRAYYMDVASKPLDEERKNKAVVAYLTNKEESKELKVIEKPAGLRKDDHQVILNIIKNGMEQYNDFSIFLGQVVDRSKVSLQELHDYINALIEERNRKERE
ncbi:TPA: hypothetical protein ACOQ40_005301 [Bacillus cereus]